MLIPVRAGLVTPLLAPSSRLHGGGRLVGLIVEGRTTMFHEIRWTAPKIKQRLALLAPLVYRRSQPLAPFRVHPLTGPLDAPPVGPDVDTSSWSEIAPDSWWGPWATTLMLRGQFTVPADWDHTAPLALVLALGDAGEFVHPEALVYVDGHSYAAC